jgi:hypothetical protein
MSGSTQAFNIQTIGSWPNETYQVSPIDRYIDPYAGYLPAEIQYRYLNTPVNETDMFHTTNYYGVSYRFSNSQYSIDTTPGSNFVWDLSAHRQNYNFGPQFNHSYVLSNPGLDTFYRVYYGYTLYPSRLFLKPISIQKNSTSWTLTTSAVLISPQTYFFSNSSLDFVLYGQHVKYSDSVPSFYALPSDIKNSFVFEISATRSMVEVPFISFTDTFNPAAASRTFDRRGGKIRPDSTHISYDISYEIPPAVTPSNLKQHLPGNNPLAPPSGFRTSYILNQTDLKNNGLQRFQLLQNKIIGSTTSLNDVTNCVLSAVFNLTSTNLQYFNLQYIKDNFTLINAVTGTPGSTIGVSYTIDSERMLFSGNACKDTVNNFSINGTSKTLGMPINYLSLNNSSSWNTKYPPHYYSYKLSLSSPSNGFSNLSDSCYLTFNLQTSVVKLNSTNALLSSFISSDHNILTYNLPDNNVNENIKYELISDNSLLKNTASLSAIKFYYGPALSTPYNIKTSPWVPAVSGNQLYIDYPNAPYGQTSLTIRSTLSSDAGYLASKRAVYITFASGIVQTTSGHDIFLETVNQGPDFFDVTCKSLTSYPDWPTKDLNLSFISWDFYPKDIGAQLYALDSEGSVMYPISAKENLLFSNMTHTVRLSGIGFTSAVIQLSSQKYNQTTTLTANSALYDPYFLNNFIIGPSSKLFNENRTRSVSLTAKLPYGGQLFDIPYNTPVAWSWDYTTSSAPTRGPINVYYGPNKTPYVYGQEMSINSLSSIYIEITPKDSDSIPTLNHVRFHLSSSVRNPSIFSTYEFVVDDFPARQVFNTDFKIGYTNFQSASGVVLDSGKNQFSLTRPNDGTNIFSLSGYSDSQINANTTYVWTISDNANTLVSIKVPYSAHFINYSINPAASLTTISLSAVKAVVYAWGNVNITDNSEFLTTPEHSTETSVNIYTPSVLDFYKPLEFVIYPEYAWLGGRNLTLLTPSNYTLSKAPSAYGYKKTSSQTFWVSANKAFDEYDYCIGSDYKFLSTLKGNVGLLDIPYTGENYDFSGSYAASGVMMSLSGFSNAYPPYASIFYVKPEGNILKTFTFPITAKTYNASNNATANIFKTHPYLTPYNINTSFSFSLATTSIDLDYGKTITLTQHITTSPLESPPQPLKDQGTITYLLSTDYWIKEIDIPAIDGEFDALTLNIGDPFEIGYVSNSKTNHLSFRPVRATIPYIIPSSTFDKYSTTAYASARDLWSSHTQISDLSANNPWQTLTVFYTGSMPQAFLSTYMALTGQEVSVEFTAPDELPNHYIVKCVTNFGEISGTTVNSVTSTNHEPAIYKYSSPGSFFIQYEVYYSDGSSKVNFIPDPIIIKPFWSSYNQEAIRSIDESVLTLPYDLDQIKIQPNEWGVADVFNTAVSRLDDNLQYLKDNSQTINSDSPTMFFGWLGCNIDKKSEGIRWYAKNFDSLYYNDLNFATNNGSSYFSNIQDIGTDGDYIFVLDDLQIRAFHNNSYKPSEVIFTGSTISSWSEEMVMPLCFDIDSKESNIYVIDPPRNKVVCWNIDYNIKSLTPILSIGGFGSMNDPGRFNSPSHIVVTDKSVLVLDSNNKCVKEYTKDLNWMHTYYTEEFVSDLPISMASVHSGVVYVLTQSYTLYVFTDLNTTKPQIYFNLIELANNREPVTKMIFDEDGSFLYFSTPTKIFKYTATPIAVKNGSTTSFNGMFVCTVDFKFPSTSIKKTSNKNLLISTSNAIAKIVDVVSLFKIGEGLPYQIWSKDQILLDRHDFASDLNYNKSLQRLVHNVKTFRNSLNAKFVKVVEKTAVGDVTYFSLMPVAVADRPVFEDDVENEIVCIGVNEFHIPPVFNRELAKIYKALDKLKEYLSISNTAEPTIANIQQNFCWSWKATSCYSLSMPSIKIDNINPITYTELKKEFPIDYAPSKLWGNAVSTNSKCCS